MLGKLNQRGPYWVAQGHVESQNPREPKSFLHWVRLDLNLEGSTKFQRHLVQLRVWRTQRWINSNPLKCERKKKIMIALFSVFICSAICCSQGSFEIEETNLEHNMGGWIVKGIWGVYPLYISQAHLNDDLLRLLLWRGSKEQGKTLFVLGFLLIHLCKRPFSRTLSHKHSYQHIFLESKHKSLLTWRKASAWGFCTH